MGLHRGEPATTGTLKAGEDIGGSKGARPKEGEDRGATGPDPRNDDSTSREMSPERTQSTLLRNRECYGLLFGVEALAPSQSRGPGAYMLPPYAWTERIIFDILNPTIDHISEIKLLNPMECLIFTGRRTKKDEGLTFGEATAYADALHAEITTWIGQQVKMHCVPRSMKDARSDLRQAKDFRRELTVEHLREQRVMSRQSEVDRRRDAPSTPGPRGRGMTWRADRYAAEKILREQRDVGRRGQSRDDWRHRERSQAAYDEDDTDAVCWNLFSGPPKTMREPRGCPLGRGRPQDIPQDFKDQFHSACEDMSDSTDDSYDSSDEEPDDIIGYDTEHLRYSTVSDREKRRKQARRRANRQAHQERRHQNIRGRPKKLSLPIFRDSSSDNAITYDDWRSDVDNLVREGHSMNLIRDSILSALEGRPHYVAKTVMDDGDGTLRCIMTALDHVYGGATSYRQMMNKLSNITQGSSEPAKDYYERVLQI